MSHSKLETKKTTIRAHKYMLSSRSPVFHTMFEGSMPEKGVISIPDVDESTFHSFLQYIYSDELSITNDNVKEMLYISDKYMITRVKSECEKVLLESALTHDAAKPLQTAYEYKLDKILKRSLSYIKNNTSCCISSKHALNLSEECLELILKSEYLNCTETELCFFFVNWTRHQCDLAKIEANGENMRTMAGHLLYFIRFPLVDPKRFTTDISTLGLLTLNETVSIFQFNFGVPVENFHFSNKIRNPASTCEIFTVTRFEEMTYGWQSACVEALKFETNKDIWLKGMVIGSLASDDFYIGYFRDIKIRIQLFRDDDKELYSFETCVQQVEPSDSCHSKTTDIMFPMPLKILKSRQYTITMEGINIKSYYSANFVNPVSANGVAFTFEKSPLCKSQTNEKRGQFAGLMFINDDIYGCVNWKYSMCSL